MSDIIRTLSCNSPKADVSAGKAFVVKACAKGKQKVIRFGDKVAAKYSQGVDASEDHNDAQRRAGAKVRHKCDQQTNKLTAGYWNCNWSR